VESGRVQRLSPEERQAVKARLRPGLEVLSLDDDPAVSIKALIAMAYLGDSNVVTQLETIYKGGNLNVKLEVTRALGYIPGNSSHRLLTRVIAEERGDGRAGALRAAALESMAQTHHRDAVRLLRYYLLNDRDPAVQDAAGRVLAEMGSGEASFAVVEHLTGGEPDAARRARLVDVLGRFRDDEVAPALLRRYLGDRDQRVRAVAALRAADHNMAEAFPFLVQLLRSGQGAQRDEAVIALENLTSVRFATKGYSALADQYSQWYEDARVKGASDRAWFRESLRRKGYDVGPLASYLNDEEDYGPIPLLIRVLRDDDPVLRRNAAIALERIVGRSFGRVERSTSQREAGRIGDEWQHWYDQRRNPKRAGR
jgi:HEAT repeat protein